MSKPYRIRIQDVVTVQDFSTFHVDPVPLMPPAEFAEILEQVLLEAGWERDEQGRVTMQIDERMTYRFEPETMQIVTEVQAAENVDQTLEGWAPDALEERGKELLERREQFLAEQTTSQLEESNQERRDACEGWVVEATGRAIKAAAERLGDVQDIHEERGEDGKYRLTITIEERQ